MRASTHKGDEMNKRSAGNPVKKGHPTNLALLTREDSLAEDIDWLHLPDLNASTWFEKISGYVNNLRFPEDEYLSGLSAAAILHIDDAFDRLATTAALKFFTDATPDKRLVPDLRLWGARRERCFKISRDLLIATRQDPHTMRYLATGYCWAAKDSMRVYLKDKKEAEFGIRFIRLVRTLNKEQRLTDFKEWRNVLEIPEPTEIECEGLRDQSSEAELEHFAIDVCIPGLKRKSREFHEVMLLAAAAELWRCVAPRKLEFQQSMSFSSIDLCLDCPHFSSPKSTIAGDSASVLQCVPNPGTRTF
jgi:hypothetical protein